MIILYEKPGCPYCKKVDEALKKLDVPFERKNVTEPGVMEELMREGGKRQTPFMVDSNVVTPPPELPHGIFDKRHGVEMYESEDIIKYLEETYGTKH